MRSSWGCCWLFLAWALLLAHPTSGQEGDGVTSVEEPQEDYSRETRGPEDGVTPLEEPYDRSLETETVTEQEVSEDSEDRLETEDMVELADVKPLRTIKEMLEERAIADRKYLKERGVGYYKGMALRFMQSENEDDPNAVYRHIEDSSITVEEAHGNIVTFRIFLTKGDCKDSLVNPEDRFEHILMRLHHRPRKPPKCEKLDCVFTLFQDARTLNEAVIDSDCQPLKLTEDIDLEDFYMSYEDTAYMFTSVEDTLNEPTSDEDALEVPTELPPSEGTSTEDTPASEGDSPAAPPSEGDDADLSDY